MANAYFTCTLEAWRSGKTLYGRMHYYRSDGQTFTYQDSSFPNPTMNLGGTVYTDTDFGNRVRAGIQVGNVYSTTFSREVAGTGDRTVTWTAGSGQRSDFAGSWSQTVNFPVEVTPPTGLGADNIVQDIESFTANVYISGWGQGTGTRYRELQCWTLGMNHPRRYQPSYGDSLSGNITVDNNSNGDLQITGNTMYTLGVYASNGQANTGSISLGGYTTRAYAPTVSVEQLTDTAAVARYALQSDGGQYAKNVQYSLDGGITWITGATINTGAAYTNTFAITGLTPNTSYTMKTRVSTNVGETNGADVTFKTYPSYEPHGDFYGSVNDVSRQINKVYGRGGDLVSFDGEIDPNSQIQFVGNVTAFNGTTFLNALKQYEYRIANWLKQNNLSLADISGVYLDVWAITQGVPEWQLLLFHKDYDDGPAWFDSSDNISLLDLGITANITQVGDDVILLSPIYSNYNSKMANKIYGSVHTQGITSISGTIDPNGVGNVTAFDGNIFWETVQKTYPERVSDIEKNFGAGSFLAAYISETGETGVYFIADNYNCVLTELGYPLTLEELGMTISTSTTEGPDIITLVATTGDVTRSKLIHQSFGHLDYLPPDYGTVYYKASASDPDSAIQQVGLQSIAEFDSLCQSAKNTWTATIGGGSVTVSNDSNNLIVGIRIGRNITVINDYFLNKCTSFNSPLVVPDNVVSIGNYFLQGCTTFNSNITLPNGLQAINSYFLYGCIAYNKPIDFLPNSVTDIGKYFLGNCNSFNSAIVFPTNLITIGESFLRANGFFNKDLVLPSTIQSVGTYFMYQCQAMISAVDVGSLPSSCIQSSNYSFATNISSSLCYTTGITIAGSNRAAWLSAFPNSTSSPYRKLIDAGY